MVPQHFTSSEITILEAKRISGRLLKRSEKSLFQSFKSVIVGVQDNKLTVKSDTKCKAVLDFSLYSAKLQVVSEVEFKLSF